MTELSTDHYETIIIRGDSPENNVIEGIKALGGIAKFIHKEDQVFINFNLTIPYGFPTNANLDTIKMIIQLCKDVGVRNILVGTFPSPELSVKTISDLFGLEKFFEDLGVKFVFLDNSNEFEKKAEDLKQIKEKTFIKRMVNNKEFLLPKVIFNSDKYILVNQINVDPLFGISLALKNNASILSKKYLKTEKKIKNREEYLMLNQYRQDLLNQIIDIYSIKQPNLVINDLFYVLEGSGPFIYHDSTLRKTNLSVIANNIIIADMITLKLLNFNPIENDLIQLFREKGFGPKNLSDIIIRGEKLEENVIDIEKCVFNLEDINLRKISIKSGNVCSACFMHAYHLLNLMKTIMIKDIKYIPKSSILIGETPSEPDFLENIILFGDCAIKSTKNYKFRKKAPKREKPKMLSAKVAKTLKPKKIKKSRKKKNKKILELNGCPPNIYPCLKKVFKYYGKKNLPNLNLFFKTINTYYNKKNIKKLEIWESL